jgi:four helix bundle protein
MIVQKFEDLEIWQLSKVLCKEIFKLSSREPFCNDYRFRDQIRASSGSIMDNIAEGFSRGGNKEFIQFLSISNGSCSEVRSQSYRALDFEYISDSELADILERTDKIIRKTNALMNHLKNSTITGPKYKSHNEKR